MSEDEKLTKVERETLRIARGLGDIAQVVDVTRRTKLTEDDVADALVTLEQRGLLRWVEQREVWVITMEGQKALRG